MSAAAPAATLPGQHVTDEEDGTIACCYVPTLSELREPVEVNDIGADDVNNINAFGRWPWFGPLLFENQTSDARDHCANERTFLSYLRLSVYMAVVSVAIVLSFHLKNQATDLELRMAKPLGAIFWVLSIACLLVGLANYIRTVNKFSQRAAIVQTGWRTQTLLATLTLCIVGSSIALLVIDKINAT